MELAEYGGPLEAAGAAGGPEAAAGAHPLRNKVGMGGYQPGPGRVGQFRVTGDCDPDIHELQKEAMFGGYPPACADHANKSTPCPDAHFGASDQYVLLDSPYKVTGPGGSDTTRGRYVFNIASQGQTTPNNIGVHDTLTNVISIETEPFYIPGPQDVPGGSTPILSPAQQTEAAQAFLYERARLYIESASEQAVHLGNNGRSNIEFRMTPEVLAGSRIRYLLEPVLRQAYSFTRPLTSMENLNFVLRGHNNQPIPLVPDTYYNVRFTPGAPVVFTYNNHGLAAGDFVHFLGFGSNSSALNTALGNERHARVVPLTANTFSLETQDAVGAFIPIDETAAISPASGTLVIPWRRIQIPLRIRTVREGVTNYKSL